jgi:hypothetical protein
VNATIKATVTAGLLALVGGCATVDVYSYQPRPLPSGSTPLAVVSWTLHDLRNVSWSYGSADPDPTRRAELGATVKGLNAATYNSTDGSPLDLSYGEIATGVRMVTQLNGSWTVYIYDQRHRLVQLEFNSYAAARLFLDAAYALATNTSTT